ncbi:MAG: hypothetical protein GMKNLPBB_02471 [Myxococcota bacterium]|nr:hypothetical protein [Myxococcota bacterium]
MKVIFIAPTATRQMHDFTRGLAEVGAQVYGVGETPHEHLPQMVRDALSGYLQVPSLSNTQQAYQHILPWARKIGPDRIECLYEMFVMLAAYLRDALGVPGMPADVSLGFRDKSVMRQRAYDAGIRVPEWRRVTTAKEVREAAEAIGYPVVVKPISGAGSRDTYLVRNKAELERILPLLAHVTLANVEEFVDGEEFTYDTVCINGSPVFESVAQYHPRPLDYHTHEWISPAQLVFRNPYTHPGLDKGIELGRKVLKALGMGTGFTHMEWYRKADGEVVFGEIGARVGGNNFPDQYNYCNDFDIFREWARSVCWGVFEAVPARKYHSGEVFKRAIGQGRIVRYENLDWMYRRLGPALCVNGLLPIGAPRRDWRMTIQSDGYIIFRHPDYQECLDMLHFIQKEVRLYAA